MSKFIVRQTFETLGGDIEATFDSLPEAEAAAATLRAQMASEISDSETPDAWSPPVGNSNEINAWQEAEEIAGVEFGDDGTRTSGSPKRSGLEAGEHVARQAVEIETVEETETDD